MSDTSEQTVPVDEVKLDTAGILQKSNGEMQQMMLMMSMMREVMNASKARAEQPPSRPSHIGSFRADIIEEMLTGRTRLGPMSTYHTSKMWDEHVKAFCNNLNNTCWKVDLPDQPVHITMHNIGTMLSYELLEYDTENRLGWISGNGMDRVRVDIRDFLSKVYRDVFNVLAKEDHFDPFYLNTLNVPNKCVGIIVDKWLYLTDCLVERVR